MIDTLRLGLSALRGWSHRHRRIIVPVSVVLFCVVLIYTVSSAGITWSTLSPSFLVFNFIVLTPVVLFLNAIGLMASGWALGARIPLGKATKVVAAGIVADLTPIPGGFAAHSGALLLSGAKAGKMGLLMSGRSIFMLGFAVLVASVALMGNEAVPAGLTGIIGTVLTVIGAGMIVSSCDPMKALVLLLQRIVTFLLIALRIFVSFASLGISIATMDAPVFATAGVVGSLAFFTPGGLGVSEALGALAAPLMDASPAGAFAAVALNRILMLALCGGIVLFSLNRETTSAE